MKYRFTYRRPEYMRARGRNGWFSPRVIEYELSEHDDGTPLVTLRLFSRREAREAPLELTMAVSDWETQALAIQLRLNEEHRQRQQRMRGLTREPRRRGHA
jgi:hypothetical protein